MSLAQLLLQVAARGTVVLLATALAARLSRRASAAVRHLIWTGGLAASLVVSLAPTLGPSLPLLPVVSPAPAILETSHGNAALPADQAGSPTQSRSASSWTGLLPLDDGPRRPTAAEPAAGGGSSSPESPATGHPQVREGELGARGAFWTSGVLSDWTSLAVAAWFVGMVLVLLRLVAGQIAIARLTRHAVPVTSPEWRSTLLEPGLLHGLGMVRFLESAEVATPCTWGFLRPTVLFPAEGAEWPAEARRQVVIHELAHIRRFDSLTHLVGSFACALHWFNPLAWLARRSARVAREQACDDAVLADGSVPSSYANLLLTAAAPEQGGPWMPVEALAMARRSQIGERLLALLDPVRRREPADRRTVGWVSLTAIALAVPVAGVGPQAPHAATSSAPVQVPELRPAPTRPGPTTTTSVATTASVASPAPVAPAGARAAGRAALAAPGSDEICLTARGSSNRTVHLNSSVSITGEGSAEDGRGNYMVAWTGPTCTIAIRLRGKATFNEAENDVAGLTEGGRFQLEHDEDGITREYLVTNRNGKLQRRYRVNDDDAEMDAKAIEWRNTLVLEFIRRSGYNAAERLARIRRQGGMAAVAREIGFLASDGVRSRYIQVALNDSAITAADVITLLGLAGSIESDGDRSRVLAAVPERFLADRGVQHAWAEGAKGIESDGDLSAVLVRVLRSNKLAADACEWLVSLTGSIESDGDRSRVLVAATDALQWNARCSRRALELTREIHSDGDKATTLVRFLRRNGLPAELIGTFFQTTATIGSDGDRSQVLHRVIDLENATDPMIAALLQDSRGIGSDGDRAAVLVDAARRGLIRSETLRAAYRASAEEIGSEGDREAALRAVMGETRRP